MGRCEEIVKELARRGLTVTTVESCTGGMIAAALTDVPGSSEVFKRGFVTYCDEAKHEMVGVRKKTLKKYTAVSAQTAVEMAEGGARAARADYCVSVTGYAGSDTGDRGLEREAAGAFEKPDKPCKAGKHPTAAEKKEKVIAAEPVGLVFIGCYVCGKTKVKELHLTGTRAQIRAQARDEALALLRKRLTKNHKN